MYQRTQQYYQANLRSRRYFTLSEDIPLYNYLETILIIPWKRNKSPILMHLDQLENPNQDYNKISD